MKPTIKMQKPVVQTAKGIELTPLNASYEERKKWYLTERWQKFRKDYLRENQKCSRCDQPAVIVDHVDGHDIDTWKETFWTGPFQALCWSCHSRKTMTEDAKNKPKRMSGAERRKVLAAL